MPSPDKKSDKVRFLQNLRHGILIQGSEIFCKHFLEVSTASPDSGRILCPGLTGNDTPLSFLPMKRFSGKFFLCTALIYLIVACATSPTGRRQLMLVSEESAIASSKQAYVEMLKSYEQQGKIDNNKALKDRVYKITGRLIAQAIKMRPETKNWEWSIKIIDDPKTVNAWAMAGGKMALYSGLVTQLKPTDDELAQVLGHEIAHALAKHSAEKMSVAMVSSAGVIAVGIFSDRKGLALTGAALAAALAVQMPNSRSAESEADRIGIELTAKAGYDPRAAITLWQKMARVGGKGPPEFLSTHPAPENREKKLAEYVPEMMPYYEQKGERPIYRL
jgi:predicted Zn-dependent protease